MTDVVVATRSHHKLAEIRQIAPSIPGLRLIDLKAAGVPADPREDALEAFPTFEENALAKARFFAARVRLPVLADDSGLCVDALGGAPGVLSKRFAGRSDLSGLELDRANNRHLLDALSRMPDAPRSARYACAVAIVTPAGQEYSFHGTVDGVILDAPRGSGGFGYDPLFFVPPLGATFAEVQQDVKNRLSHRARAVEAALPRLRALADSPARHPPRDPSSG
jgi:XTP/dITP diphosphohydrolase